jgi:nucleoside-diphosphate-sugar epimerase
MFTSPLSADLDHILAYTQDLWFDMRGQHIFITGGTGFIGQWLLESFVWANQRLSLGATAVVLTHSPADFASRRPDLAACPSIQLVPGDVRSFACLCGEFPFVIHAATDARRDALSTFDSIVNGTRRVLDFATAHGLGKFLLLSSGAVYGNCHAPVCEQDNYAPNPLSPLSAYAEGKRAAEHLCALYHAQCSLPVKIARLFSFMGPYLPADGRFAAGTFLQQAAAGNPVRVYGGEHIYRSYLYPSDLMIWLWTILFQGLECRAYNVGADFPICILDLARHIAKESGVPCKEGLPESLGRHPYYIPDIRRAGAELNLRPTVDLHSTISKSVAWFKQSQPHALFAAL